MILVHLFVSVYVWVEVEVRAFDCEIITPADARCPTTARRTFGLYYFFFFPLLSISSQLKKKSMLRGGGASDFFFFFNWPSCERCRAVGLKRIRRRVRTVRVKTRTDIFYFVRKSPAA